jgi:hypothetical protein
VKLEKYVLAQAIFRVRLLYLLLFKAFLAWKVERKKHNFYLYNILLFVICFINQNCSDSETFLRSCKNFLKVL